MNELIDSCEALSDGELTSRLHSLVKAEREDLKTLLVHLGEFDARDLATRLNAMPSLFVYCTQKLGYSEQSAYRRIYAARAAKKFRLILAMLESGETHLDAVARLGPYLTAENHLEILAKSKGMTRLEIKFLARSLDPRPDKADHIRIVPAAVADSATGEPRATTVASLFGRTTVEGEPMAQSPSPSPWERYVARHSIEPLSAERVRFAFTGSKSFLALVDRSRQILKHKYPGGELEKIFEEALDALLDRKDPERRLKRLEQSGKRAPDPAECDPRSRRIPQGVRDEVWRRDGGQCAHVGTDGERCPERGGLEFDHVVPHALGGPSNNPKNIRLLCRAHNRAAAVRFFGDAATRHWARPST